MIGFPRCGEVDSFPGEESPDSCCYRPTWKDRDKCIWHAEEPQKPIKSLLAAIDSERSAPQSHVVRPYLAHQTDQAAIDIGGIEFIAPRFEDIEIFDNLSDAEFRGGHFRQVDLYQSKADNAIFRSVDIEGCDFDAMSVDEIRFDDCTISNTSFTKSRLNKLQINGGKIFDCSFNGEIFSGSIQNTTRFENIQFREARCEGVMFSGVTLTECVFSETRMAESDFDSFKLEDTIFDRAQLGAVSFTRGTIVNCGFEESTLNATFRTVDVDTLSFSGRSTLSSVSFEESGTLEALEFGGEARIEQLEINGVDGVVGLSLDQTVVGQFVVRDTTFARPEISDPDTSLVERCSFEFEHIKIDAGDIYRFDPDKLVLREVEFLDVDTHRFVIPSSDKSHVSKVHVQDGRWTRFDYRPDSFSGITFEHTHLFCAQFERLDAAGTTGLSSARLNYADLSEADLSEARLTGCQLFGADLRETLLDNTDLRGASCLMTCFGGANLRDARIDHRTTFDDRLLHEFATTGGFDADSLDQAHHRMNRGGLLAQIPGMSGDPIRPTLSRILRAFKASTEGERRRERRQFTDCIDQYRHLQQVHDRNGIPQQARRYRIRAREVRRRLSLTEGDVSSWWISNVFNLFRYGESSVRLGAISVIVILGCGLIYPFFGGVRMGTSTGPRRFAFGPVDFFGVTLPIEFSLGGLPEPVVDVLVSMYFSVVTFTTLGYGDAQPVGVVAKLIAGLESVFGVVLMAVLVFALTRQATR